MNKRKDYLVKRVLVRKGVCGDDRDNTVYRASVYMGKGGCIKEVVSKGV